MKVECICEQNCASSVCVAILGQGNGLMENYHSSNSDLLSQTAISCGNMISVEEYMVRYKLNPNEWF